MSIFYDLFRNEPHIVRRQAGETLFQQGDACDGTMYVLLAGRADIFLGKRRVEECEPGAIFGEMAMVEAQPRTASVFARADCEFAVIDRKRFHYLVAETPYFATEVMRAMALRMRHCDDLLET